MKKMNSIGVRMIVVCCCVLVVLAGCSKKGANRRDVWGNVTFKGQPIPLGVINFDPDVSKGVVGPLGYATIKDGKFDTRTSSLLKGCVPGAHKVIIKAGDGKNASEANPFGNRLFAEFITSVEIPQDGGELNFAIP